MQIDSFVAKLAAIQLVDVFNPYSNVCALYDKSNSAEIRQENLRAYLRAAQRSKPSSIWFGRDLGHRGGRRTGLALTDEVRLPFVAKLMNAPHIQKATAGPVMSERTATEIWSMIDLLPSAPFLWNVFPFHPHTAIDAFTNRRHLARELSVCEFATLELIRWLEPTRVLALGNDAYRTLSALGIKSTCVRHPSYGGKTEFVSGISKLYNFRN